jgi:hypothetical protein
MGEYPDSPPPASGRTGISAVHPISTERMAVSGGMRSLQTPPRALPRKAPARARAQEASKLAGEQTTQTPPPYHPTAPTRRARVRVAAEFRQRTVRELDASRGEGSALRARVEQRVCAATNPSRNARNHQGTAQGVWRIRKGVPGVGRQPMSKTAATRLNS